MRILAFSDLHCDLDQAARLVELSADADVVIGAGDFASVHRGLEETIGALAGIDAPTVLVPGNNETEDALREAVAGWEAAQVLHGAATTIDLEHDRASRAAGEKVRCPMLALWGAKGSIPKWYDAPAIWKDYAAGPLETGDVPSGHYLAEEAPEAVLARLEGFLRS